MLSGDANEEGRHPVWISVREFHLINLYVHCGWWRRNTIFTMDLPFDFAFEVYNKSVYAQAETLFGSHKNFACNKYKGAKAESDGIPQVWVSIFWRRKCAFLRRAMPVSKHMAARLKGIREAL
jgi:hypothetical protein